MLARNLSSIIVHLAISHTALSSTCSISILSRDMPISSGYESNYYGLSANADVRKGRHVERNCLQNRWQP